MQRVGDYTELTKRIDSLESNMNQQFAVLIEQGSDNKTNLRLIQEDVSQHTALLKQLAYKFKSKIHRQQMWLFSVTTTLILLLFWLVYHI